MDPQGIASLITAGTGVIAIVGTAVAWLARQQKQRQDEEKALRADHEAQVEKLQRRNWRLREVAELWRLQLVRNDIDPVPPGWPEGDA